MAKTWLLNFTSPTSSDPLGDGRPWGDGSEIGLRAAGGSDPWDTDCAVTPLIGGFMTMASIRTDLLDAVTKGKAIGQMGDDRGHVYIAGYRINPLRDLSTNNSAWTLSTGWKPGDAADSDETAAGLILKLMQAGIRVRILVWQPTKWQRYWGEFYGHSDEHFYLADMVRAESDRLKKDYPALDSGVVCLDGRVGPGNEAGAHHQKFIVIRVGDLNVAYVGGVDLAFTRRDAPKDMTGVDLTKPGIFFDGDWQSGNNMPKVKNKWPQDSVTKYDALSNLADPPNDSSSDLVVDVYGDKLQRWHDQHLRLQGAIVYTLEQHFAERWIRKGKVYAAKNHRKCGWGEAILSDWLSVSFDPTGAGVVSSNVITLPSALKQQGGSDLKSGDKVDYSSGAGTSKAIGGLKDGDSYYVVVVDSTHVKLDTDQGDAQSGSPSKIITLDGTVAAGTYHSLTLIGKEDDPIPELLIGNQITDKPGTLTIQTWRTIPLPKVTPAPNFTRGEFTVLAGVANAIQQATELIWIFDQYFWSLAFSRLVNKQLQANAGLRVIVILPPHADDAHSKKEQHYARFEALDALTKGVPSWLSRVGVYDLWDKGGNQRGIYCHAKVHMYDGALLVCGSANVNRRSYLGDSELVCAIPDDQLVAQHQQNLWSLLFGNTAVPWPGLDLNNPGAGQAFFTKFDAAANDSKSFLIPDPWRQQPKPTLPGGIVRDDYHGGMYAYLKERFDYRCVDAGVEAGDADLQLLYERLEKTPGADNSWPYRKPDW